VISKVGVGGRWKEVAGIEVAGKDSQKSFFQG
jgi:hypothetical protein